MASAFSFFLYMTILDHVSLKGDMNGLLTHPGVQ